LINNVAIIKPEKSYVYPLTLNPEFVGPLKLANTSDASKRNTLLPYPCDFYQI
jgi:hypothetical protein